MLGTPSVAESPVRGVLFATSHETMAVPPCPLCESMNVFYSFAVGDDRFDQCLDCGLLYRKASLAAPDAADDVPPRMSDAFARRWLDLVVRYLGRARGRIGIAGGVPPALVAEARHRGLEVVALDDAGPSAPCDAVLVVDALEGSDAPAALVRSLRDLLAPGGVLALATRGVTRPGPRRHGDEPIPRGQRFAYTEDNLQTLLARAGFGRVVLGRDLRAAGWAPGWSLAFGTMGALGARPTLSIVVPVYNEAATLRQVLDALVAKRLPDVDTEVVIVESNSTDGSREIVLGYRGRPNVRVVLQPEARGKGSAVREGIEHATGDVILIQDADLEYDILDYEVLVHPIVAGRAHFVLGTRHAGHWKIRQFAEVQAFLADVLNLSHWALVAIMNRLYRQTLTDPFTMFKVFRRDCLYGVDFECDLFDFDVELVCKLLRKGYTPLEIPVNYRARSFAEGKKIRFLRDGWNCIRAILKYRRRPVFALPAA
jgi:hypothetical protein